MWHSNFVPNSFVGVPFRRRPVVHFIEIEIEIGIGIETDGDGDVRAFDPDLDSDPDDMGQTPCRTLLGQAPGVSHILAQASEELPFLHVGQIVPAAASQKPVECLGDRGCLLGRSRPAQINPTDQLAHRQVPVELVVGQRAGLLGGGQV